MRDVAYGQVPKGLRAQLHLGFTEWVKDLPSQRGRIRGDRRVAPRAGVPARARGHAKPDRTADPGGRGHARRGGRPRRAPREPARGASLLHACPRPARRRARRPARRAAPAAGGHGDAARRAQGSDRRAARGRGAAPPSSAAPRSKRRRCSCSATSTSARGGRTTRIAGSSRPRSSPVRPTTRAFARRVAFVLNTFVVDYLGELDQAIENLRAAIAAAEEIDDRALVAEGHLRIAALLMSHDLAAAESGAPPLSRARGRPR